MFDEAPPALLMSHFVSSEEPEDVVNQRQIDHFAAIAALARARYPDIRCSFSNSSGIFLKEKPFHDLVRPGYALYGGNPCPGRPNPMEPVVRLEARIIQTRWIEPGDSVGYNAQWTARRPTRIATISLGYADGVFRALSGTDARPGRRRWSAASSARLPVASRWI